MAAEQRSQAEEHLSEPSGEQAVIALSEEQIVINKRFVETALVRLHKFTEERTETIEVPLTSVTWGVEHVPMDRVLVQTPGIRQEGKTTVYPVVEERVTILRELVLVEEVRVTRMEATTVQRSTQVLRRERVAEERIPRAPERSGTESL